MSSLSRSLSRSRSRSLSEARSERLGLGANGSAGPTGRRGSGGRRRHSTHASIDSLLTRCMICTLLSLFSWISPAMAANRERSFIMIKPDGVQRGIVGEVIKRFEQKGFKLVAIKFMNVRLCITSLIIYQSVA